MALINDLRNKKITKTYSKKNNDIFDEYLNKTLSREQLTGVMDMIEYPEIHQPLMKNMDSLLKQPNFDDEMKTKFSVFLNVLPESKKTNKAIATLNKSLETDDDLVGKLSIKDREKKPSALERMRNRIKSTYEDISTRVDMAKDKFKASVIDSKNRVVNKVTDTTDKGKQKLKNTVDNVNVVRGMITDGAKSKANDAKMAVKPAVDMLVDRLRDKANNIKYEYQVRKLSIKNSQNLKSALEKGMNIDDIADGIDYVDLPEVRYGMMENAEAILNHPDMTTELANTFKANIESYLDDTPNNSAKKAFINAFNKDREFPADNRQKEVPEVKQESKDVITKENEEPIIPAKAPKETDVPKETVMQDIEMEHLDELSFEGLADLMPPENISLDGLDDIMPPDDIYSLT